jgi:hypothetical protein
MTILAEIMEKFYTGNLRYLKNIRIFKIRLSLKNAVKHRRSLEKIPAPITPHPHPQIFSSRHMWGGIGFANTPVGKENLQP